jgi:hypothetical protein
MRTGARPEDESSAPCRKVGTRDSSGKRKPRQTRVLRIGSRHAAAPESGCSSQTRVFESCNESGGRSKHAQPLREFTMLETVSSSPGRQALPGRGRSRAGPVRNDPGKTSGAALPYDAKTSAAGGALLAVSGVRCDLDSDPEWESRNWVGTVEAALGRQAGSQPGCPLIGGPLAGGPGQGERKVSLSTRRWSGGAVPGIPYPWRFGGRRL